MKCALIVKMFPPSKAMYHWKHHDRVITRHEIANALIIVNVDTGEIIKNKLATPVNPEYKKIEAGVLGLDKSKGGYTIESLRSSVNSHPVKIDSDGNGCSACYYSYMRSWLGCYREQCPTKVGSKC